MSYRLISFFILSLILITGLSLWLVPASEAEAVTYYTATDGNESNSGSEASPFRTINKGVSGLKPGDTLYIKSGTYAEALRNAIPGGTSWSNPVTVAAMPGHTVTLRPSGQLCIIAIGIRQAIYCGAGINS